MDDVPPKPSCWADGVERAFTIPRTVRVGSELIPRCDEDGPYVQVELEDGTTQKVRPNA